MSSILSTINSSMLLASKENLKHKKMIEYFNKQLLYHSGLKCINDNDKDSIASKEEEEVVSTEEDAL